MERTSESGFPVDPVYDASKLTDFQPEAKLGRPGEYPFTRGVYPRMYVDLPTQLGYDSGAPAADEALAPPSTKAAAGALLDRIEVMGGAAAAIERGFRKAEIEGAAYQVAREIDEGDRIVVGVNKFAADGEEPYQPLRVDPAIEAAKAEHLAQLRQARDSGAVSRAISALKRPRKGPGTSFTRSATRCGPTPRSVKCAMRSEISGGSITPVKCDFPYWHQVGAGT